VNEQSSPIIGKVGSGTHMDGNRVYQARGRCSLVTCLSVPLRLHTCGPFLPAPYTTRMRPFRMAPLGTLAALLGFNPITTVAGSAGPQSVPLQSGALGSEAEIACRAYPRTTKSYKRKLWDGYEISLGPTRDDQGDGDDCTAAIYNREGKVVYRTTGFNVSFDEHLTGQDFDGDGKPEVVFQTDRGGGMHCCWEYNVISLYPRPHKLFDITQEGADQFEKDAQGKMVIWVRTAGPGGAFSMAQRPFAERVFRVREGKLVDVTPEFSARIFSDQNSDFRTWSAELTPENIQRLGSSANPEENQDLEEIASSLLSRAIQHVFCRQFDAALADLDLWPESTRAEAKAQFAAFIKKDFPEFAAQLAKPPKLSRRSFDFKSRLGKSSPTQV